MQTSVPSHRHRPRLFSASAERARTWPGSGFRLHGVKARRLIHLSAEGDLQQRQEAMAATADFSSTGKSRLQIFDEFLASLASAKRKNSARARRVHDAVSALTDHGQGPPRKPLGCFFDFHMETARGMGSPY